MKRPTKHKSDVDIRGRIRRGPQEESGTLIPAKFMDGPLAGSLRPVVRGSDYVKVGFWRYSFAGKDGKVPVYCKLPKSRRERKILMFMIGKRGGDPRPQMALARSKPTTRTTPPKAGQGRRRREAERKLRAEQAAWRASDGYNGT